MDFNKAGNGLHLVERARRKNSPLAAKSIPPKSAIVDQDPQRIEDLLRKSTFSHRVTTQPGKNERNFRGSRRSGRVTGAGEPGAVCGGNGEGDYPEKQEGRMGAPRKAAVRPTKTFLEFFLRVSV